MNIVENAIEINLNEEISRGRASEIFAVSHFANTIVVKVETSFPVCAWIGEISVHNAAIPAGQ